MREAGRCTDGMVKEGIRLGYIKTKAEGPSLSINVGVSLQRSMVHAKHQMAALAASWFTKVHGICQTQDGPLAASWFTKVHQMTVLGASWFTKVHGICQTPDGNPGGWLVYKGLWHMPDTWWQYWELVGLQRSMTYASHQMAVLAASCRLVDFSDVGFLVQGLYPIGVVEGEGLFQRECVGEEWWWLRW